MTWYIPLTIIPGIALIIMSTSNFVVALNTEISLLKKEGSDQNRSIIKLKLNQLTRLSIAISFQYLSLLLLLLSGVTQGLKEQTNTLGKAFLISGVILATLSISILIFYSIKALFIRRKHLSL